MAAFRMKYVRWLQKYIGVHIYGDCGTYKCGKVYLDITNNQQSSSNPAISKYIHSREVHFYLFHFIYFYLFHFIYFSLFHFIYFYLFSLYIFLSFSLYIFLSFSLYIFLSFSQPRSMSQGGYSIQQDPCFDLVNRKYK